MHVTYMAVKVQDARPTRMLRRIYWPAPPLPYWSPAGRRASQASQKVRHASSLVPKAGERVAVAVRRCHHLPQMLRS